MTAPSATEADVEAVARAMHAVALAAEADDEKPSGWDGEHPDHQAEFRAMARAAIAADSGRKRMEEALRNVASMKLFPDNAINQMTLVAAIRVARAALGEAGGKEEDTNG